MFYIKRVAHREYRNMTSTDRRWQLRYCENTRKTGARDCGTGNIQGV